MVISNNAPTSTVMLEKTRAMDDTPPPPPPGSPVHFSRTPGSPLKCSPAKTKHQHGGVCVEKSKDNITDASSSSSFSHEECSNSTSVLHSPPLLFVVEEGTPAAAALKANADVRVSKLRKVGRSVRVLKSGSRTSRGGGGTHVRSRSLPSIDPPPAAILEVDDEGGSDHGAEGENNRHDGDESYDPTTSQDNDLDKSTETIDPDKTRDEKLISTLGTPSSGTDKGNQTKTTSGTPIVLLSQQHVQSRNGQKASPAFVVPASYTREDNIGDTSTDLDKQVHSPPSAPIESLLIAQHPVQRHSGQFTHLASSAAVAAACLAGEEIDRKRAAKFVEFGLDEGAEDTTETTGHAHKSNIKQPFTHPFKPESVSIDDSDVPIKRSPRPSILRRRACSVSEGIAQLPLLPRGAHNGSSSAVAASLTTIEQHHEMMPSEISIAETVKHANVREGREDDAHPTVLDLDDGDTLNAEETCEEDTLKAHQEKQIKFNPILVEISGSIGSNMTNREASIEESKEEEEIPIMLDKEREADQHKALMTKARKKLARMAIKKKEVIHDDDSFYFHGPKSVRKWVKRRRSMEENKDLRSYVKGKVIDGKHELYTMSIAVMFGMRTSIGRTNLDMSQTAHNSLRWLDNDDLMAVEKYEFPPRVSVLDTYFLPHHQ